MKNALHIADFTYDLPEARIAKFPLEQRENAKLLIFKNQEISDASFADVPSLISPDSLLVFNNTKVVQARLLFVKTEGAKPIEVFCLEPNNQDVAQAMAQQYKVSFQCLVGNAKRWKDQLILEKKLLVNGKTFVLKAQKTGRLGDAFLIDFVWNAPLTFAEVLELAGKVPLPPYLNRSSQAGDKERYQTVYAKHNGSVAAPTAGLHFTPEILEKLAQKNVTLAETTLHVGAGTFKPVSTPDVRNHTMHAEEIHVNIDFLNQLAAHKNELFCVGTTSVRTLESLYWLGVKIAISPESDCGFLAQWDAYKLPQNIHFSVAIEALITHVEESGANQFYAQTQLIIAPGYKFRVIDGLFTNFHQPGSTLILLVAAATQNMWRKIYTHALVHNYRFLSFGDSSFVHIPKGAKINRF